MRVLFTTQPGFGHLTPMLPYANALADAGHEVRIASAPPFAEAIEGAGFRSIPIGIPFTWEDFGTYFPELARAMRLDPGAFLSNECSWTHWNGTAARDLLASFDDWRPDVLVRESAENGATFAGLAARIPVACSTWSALPTDRDRWSMVLDWPTHLRGYSAVALELGVGTGDPGQAWADQLTLTGLGASWYSGAVTPRRLHGFRLVDELVDAVELPSDPARGGRDRPLIYATLGTVYNGFRSLRRAMLDALAGLDADVVFTVGRNVDPESIGSVPANVHVERYVPQDAVVSRASLVLSHAGLGTMLGALYRGVPMVVVAIGADQAVNADSAARQGVAITMPAGSADADSLLTASKRILDDPAFALRAASCRDELAALAPVATVTDLFAREFGDASSRREG